MATTPTPLEVNRFETPFIWNVPINEHHIDQFIQIETEKLENSSEESTFQWMKYILNLLLGYEQWSKKKDAVQALRHIHYCETHFKQLAMDGCRENLFVSLQPALRHVTLATKLRVLHESNPALASEEKQKIISRIMPMNKMTGKERAGIIGIKAGIYLQYGTPGHRLALEAARQASKLDPDQAEWFFLIGNALGRLRRTESRKEIDIEELEVIEKAIKLQPDASYIVNLAQLYAEFSAQLFFSRSDPGNVKKSKEYAHKAVQTFQTAIELRPNCASMMARVAHGLLRVKCVEALDLNYIKNLLLKLIEQTPNNSMAFHDLGVYYEKFEKQKITEAMKCFTKSDDLGNEKALLSLTALRWKMGLERDIIEGLQRGLQRYQSDENQAELYSILGSCYILVESDWENAVKCFIKCLEVDPKAKYLQGFGGFTGRRVDLLHIVTSELLLNTQHLTDETKHTFLDKCKSFGNNQPGRNFFNKWEKDQIMVKKYNRSNNRV